MICIFIFIYIYISYVYTCTFSNCIHNFNLYISQVGKCPVWALLSRRTEPRPVRRFFWLASFSCRSWRIQGFRDPPRRDLQTPRLSAKAVERRSGISILLISCPIGMATDSAGWTIVKSYAHKHGAVLFLLFSLSRVCVQFHLIPGYSRNLAIAFHVHFLLAFNYL